METTLGCSRQSDRPPSSSADPQPPASGRAEQVYFTIGAVALTVAIVLCLFERGRHVEMPRGLYAILAAFVVIGGVGWTVAWSVARAEGRVRATVAADMRHMVRGLAELTSQVQNLAAVVQEQTRSRPTRQLAACRGVGHMYASQAAQGEDTVGIRPASVEPATDPSGASLQRAREAGIEQGFEIGYRAQLADLGVTPLPTARRPRLTGDS